MYFLPFLQPFYWRVAKQTCHILRPLFLVFSACNGELQFCQGGHTSPLEALANMSQKPATQTWQRGKSGQQGSGHKSDVLSGSRIVFFRRTRPKLLNMWRLRLRQAMQARLAELEGQQATILVCPMTGHRVGWRLLSGR